MTEEPAEAENQEAVIAFLSSPETYLIDGPVERIDTHAAIVFLAGERAFKLKRAVRFSYLDFSTVAKRKEVCEAELALNRRTAPELYLGVLSVNRDEDGTIGFGAAGKAIDWLVVMRRFDAGSLLEAVAARNELDDGLVRDLADEIARFHESAEVKMLENGAERVRSVIEGNRQSMAALPPEALNADDASALHQASLAELARHAAVLDRRAASGHARHCHGDLHLANVCLWRGRPTLFDCLEFDPALATSDVLYDLAFLLMDLSERGYAAQASLLFNRYLDMREEGDGLAALPLFLSMRAAVRAHVTAAAAGRQYAPENRRAKLAQARSYLVAARAFLEPAKPLLVAIGGLSGTGKSTLAGMLAPKLGNAPGARWLRTDVLRKRLAGVKPEVPLPHQAYSRENTAAVYARLFEEAAAVLAAGRPVIVDGVFADPAERMKIAQTAAAAGVRFTGLWLEAPPQTLRDRVSGRRGDASDADGEVVERQLGYDIGDLGTWARVDAGGAPEAMLSRALVHTQ